MEMSQGSSGSSPFGAFSSHDCFFVKFWALWVVTKQPLPRQYNVLSVGPPYTSSSETRCLKLHVITALYRLKEANLLGEKLAVSLGIVPDTSVSSKTEICKKILISFFYYSLCY